MDLRLMSLRTTRWGVAVVAAVTTVATATAMYAPATQATLASGGVGAAASAPSLALFARANGGFTDDRWGDPKEDHMSSDAAGQYQASLDPGSLYTVEKAIGARTLWAKNDNNQRAMTGYGVGVAVLDSGESQVSGLDGSGKVTYGPDLSVEGNGVMLHEDTFGHGTYMAGIIAGRGTTSSSSGLSTEAASVQLGVAPDAKLLALKLATRDGSTDVSQVIAALDWVTQNPVMPNGTRVRVINLSYGTNSAQSYLADPLAAAAENAWKHGIVVVTSAGNGDDETGRLTDPAIDPYVLAVGSTDNGGTMDGWIPSKASVAHYSQLGTAARHVDLVAPGRSVVSLRAPGSYIDVKHPEGLVAGDTSGKLFRGSGTSQAAAVVSGSVALILQANPNLTPDQVKYVLTSSAAPLTQATTLTAGAGTLDLAKALTIAKSMNGDGDTASNQRDDAVQSFPTSTGQGSIDAARAGSILVDSAGIDLVGEIDIQGNPWRPAAWWKATSTESAWYGGRWMGTTWTGDRWASSSTWSSSRWSSSRWSTANWASSTWTSSRWSSSRWSSSRWSSLLWTDFGWF
ncbi:MAG: serine protease AprX [Actinomycetota bacterium]|nr:serine protease AprX [Actinomycetota bacterium]